MNRRVIISAVTLATGTALLAAPQPPPGVVMGPASAQPEFVRQEKAKAALARILAGQSVRATNLTAEQIAEIVDVFEEWTVGTPYDIGDVRRYDGDVYECVRAHTSQSDWTPDAVPALWKSHAPAGVIPEWVQPTGAHDAYQTGDMVTFEGSVYRSLIDANVWSPTAYPAGWELVE